MATDAVRCPFAVVIEPGSGGDGTPFIPADEGIGMHVNVGCGATPTEGWANYDNSLTVLLAASPVVRGLARRLGWLSAEQEHFARTARERGIQHADALHLPIPDRTVDVLYSSHMVEHMDRATAQTFLAECHRVLRPGGVIRLALPDIGRMVEEYIVAGDADAFVARTHLARPTPHGFRGRLHALAVGDRGHRWMYDAESAVTLLTGAGFAEAVCLPPGETKINNPGALDLREREEESLYVEARAPVPPREL